VLLKDAFSFPEYKDPNEATSGTGAAPAPKKAKACKERGIVIKT
jgi:hypothetical protein